MERELIFHSGGTKQIWGKPPVCTQQHSIPSARQGYKVSLGCFYYRSFTDAATFLGVAEARQVK